MIAEYGYDGSQYVKSDLYPKQKFQGERWIAECVEMGLHIRYRQDQNLHSGEMSSKQFRFLMLGMPRIEALLW